MNKQETIADIIAAMRDEGHTGESSCLEWVGTKMRYYADRLEAAQKHEKAAIEADALAAGGLVEASRATAENSSVVGDCAKLREALEKLVSFIQRFRENVENYGIDMYYSSAYDKDIKELEGRVSHARTAPAAPPRNCEVGTAEEQVKRHKEWCDRNTCMFTYSCRVCFAKWAQMPYEEGGAK